MQFFVFLYAYKIQCVDTRYNDSFTQGLTKSKNEYAAIYIVVIWTAVTPLLQEIQMVILLCILNWKDVLKTCSLTWQLSVSYTDKFEGMNYLDNMDWLSI